MATPQKNTRCASTVEHAQRVHESGHPLDLRRSNLGHFHHRMYRTLRSVFSTVLHCLVVPSVECGALHPGRGHRLPNSCRILVAHLAAPGPLLDPVGRPRLPLAAGSVTPSQLGVDMATPGVIVVAASFAVVRGSPLVSLGWHPRASWSGSCLWLLYSSGSSPIVLPLCDRLALQRRARSR